MVPGVNFSSMLVMNLSNCCCCRSWAACCEVNKACNKDVASNVGGGGGGAVDSAEMVATGTSLTSSECEVGGAFLRVIGAMDRMNLIPNCYESG